MQVQVFTSGFPMINQEAQNVFIIKKNTTGFFKGPAR